MHRIPNGTRPQGVRERSTTDRGPPQSRALPHQEHLKGIDKGKWVRCQARAHRVRTAPPGHPGADRPYRPASNPTPDTHQTGATDTVRAFRVFNGLGRTVDIEWTVFGQRYRFWSMTAVVAVLAAAAALIPLISLFAALPAAGLGLAVVLMYTARLNRMDPEGYLRELTQLRVLYRSATRPSISNIRNHSIAGRARITNTGRR